MQQCLMVRSKLTVDVVNSPIATYIYMYILRSSYFLFYGSIGSSVTKRNTDANASVDGAPPQFVEILRGRDGRDGRDGQAGSRGPPGMIGPRGEKGESGSQGLPAVVTGGVTYTRWGREDCPNTAGTELLYSGRAGGSWYNHKGGGANYLCLTGEPEYSDYAAGNQASSFVYGAEYEISANQPYRPLHDQNVPCAVCYIPTRFTVVMIPGRMSCPSMWTQEYFGYLMSAHHGHEGRTVYECMDRDPQAIEGGQGDQNGALFYHNEARCGSLSCPPYIEEKEITCTVCSK